MPKKKIVYLFGAGATHAEVINSTDDPNAVYRDKKGLLISDVSKRVMQKARENPWFKQNEEVFTSSKGSLNIELLISLFETNQIGGEHTQHLKSLVEDDIKNVLTGKLKRQFYLHKGLLELHEKTKKEEELLGFISLNYDDVLDGAYRAVFNHKPNYCLTSKPNNDLPPLLKLHGSFTWKKIKTYSREKSIHIIPLGMRKNYLFPPYNFIWGKAYELLVTCDTLRIIGCSLNQADLGLVDLLFKAHLEREKQIDIEVIDFQPENSPHSIKSSFGFFPGIIEPKDIEGTLIANEMISNYDIANPFKIWLRAKGEKMLGSKIKTTTYLKKLQNT